MESEERARHGYGAYEGNGERGKRVGGLNDAEKKSK
jgi:hypothetical protein